MISVVFAVLTALSNGTASVLQRRAASTAPNAEAMHVAIIRDLLRRRVWLAGIGLVIVAAVCQAVALGTGPIAVVQPIFVIELPGTLLIASRMFRIRLPRRTWYGVIAVACGLALGMGSAAPDGGSQTVQGSVWIPALVATLGFDGLLISLALRVRGNPRAALLGLAAACAYALTAALMKDAVSRLGHPGGVAAFFTSWQLYAMAVAGIGALFLLQNALQAGLLAASQPMLTLGDAVISVTFGVTLFGEHLRTGWWLLGVLIALVLIAAGCVELARSPLASGAPPAPGSEPRRAT